MKTLLLVTWIVTGQPPSSYQTPFDTMEACLGARATVVLEADRLNAGSDQNAAQISEMKQQMYNRLVMTGMPPGEVIDTVQKYFQMVSPPRPQSRVSAVCVAQ